MLLVILPMWEVIKTEKLMVCFVERIVLFLNIKPLEIFGPDKC